MSNVIVVCNVTLDGVMQAPARPDEDRRGGFEHGGWALPHHDGVIGERITQGMFQAGSLLFGRRAWSAAGFTSVAERLPRPNWSSPSRYFDDEAYREICEPAFGPGLAVKALSAAAVLAAPQRSAA